MRKNVSHHLVKRLHRTTSWIGGVTALFVMAALLLWAQPSTPPQPPGTPAPQSSQASTKTLPPIQLDGDAAVEHLNHVISWFHHSTTGLQSVGLPSDAIYQDNMQGFAAEVVRLAFQSAKAEAALMAAQQKNSGSNPVSSETTQQQALARMHAKTST